MSDPDSAPRHSEQSGRIASLQLVGVRRGPECDGLVTWLDELLDELRPDCDGLNLRLVTDDEMRRLNREFRDQDRPTDVLSFPGETTPEGEHLGDIVIALGVAERQAAELGHSLATELRTLALHGVLHCMGYDHEVDEGQMDTLELQLRHRWIGPIDGGDHPS